MSYWMALGVAHDKPNPLDMGAVAIYLNLLHKHVLWLSCQPQEGTFELGRTPLCHAGESFARNVARLAIMVRLCDH